MPRRFALIIGNSNYDDQTLARLKTPEADVQTLAAALRDPQLGGFDEVQELVNQPESAVRRAISAFYLQKKSDDLLLLYFSGHGVLDAQGRLFLAVKDTQRDLLNATAIAASFVTDDMDACRSKRQILILDCCHSGAFARGAKGDAPAVTQSTFEGTGFGRVVLTASDSTQYALEGDQVIQQASLSLFTHYLLEGLTTGQADSAQDGWITLDEWYDYAYDRVVSETPDQTPRKWVYNQQGELVISRNPNPVSLEPTDLPAELKLAIESPFVGVRADAVEELKRQLRGSNPALAQAAYQALQTLASHDDSRRIASAAEEALAGFTPPQKPAVEEAVPTETRLPPVHPEDIQADLTKKAEAERVEREKAEQAAQKAEAERQAAAKAEQERLALAKAQAERASAERAEAERIAQEKAEADRRAKEKAEGERVEARLANVSRYTPDVNRAPPPPGQGAANLPFIGDLTPKKFNAGETAELAIRTASQAPATFTVDFSDEKGGLSFTPPRLELTVQPGETATVRFRAVPRQRPLITYQTYPIQARVTASSGEVQDLAGAVTARPLAPAWLLIPGAALIVLCLLFYGVYQWLIAPGVKEYRANATATYIAALNLLLTPTPMAPLPATSAPATVPGATLAPVINPTAAPNPTEAPPTLAPTAPAVVSRPQHPSLAFASNRDGNWEIYLLNLDNNHLQRLTDNPADDSSPVFSPDGSKILFHSDRNGNFDIFVMNFDGSGLKQLTNNPKADTYASWSPDGKQVVFQSKRDGNKQIYVMDADGSHQTRLTHDNTDVQFPSWSPDGQWILYTTQIDDKLAVLSIMHTDGSGERQLDVGNYAGISFTFPVWSPDGSHIAAVNTYSDNRNEIFVGVFTNGKIDAEFTFGGGAGDTTTLTQPRWSSDGKSIYFASNENGNFDIFRLNADGSGGGWVVTDPSDDEAPSEFSP